MKLGLGIIKAGGYGEAIPSRFEQSFYALHSEILRGKMPPVSDLLRIDSGKFPIDCARNEIVREALREGCDALLFLDVDHVFTPDVIRRLLDADRPIITARYHVKKPPYHPNLYVVPTVDHLPGEFKTVHYGHGVFTVDRCGAGGLLIQRQVLEDIGDPWFRYQQEPQPPHDMSVSEDFHFCARAQQEGYYIWADWDAEMGHLIQGIVTGAWYEDYLRTMEAELPEKPELADDLVSLGGSHTLPSGRVIQPYGSAPLTPEEIARRKVNSTSAYESAQWDKALDHVDQRREKVSG